MEISWIKNGILLQKSPEIVKGITERLAGKIITVELRPFKQGEFYESPLAVEAWNKLNQLVFRK